LPLKEIQAILDQPGFDSLEALHSHKRTLQAQVSCLETLLETIEKTINQFSETNMTLTDAELYEGFSKEEAECYQQEARQLYGSEQVEASEQRVRRLSKAQWQALKDEGEALNRQLADLMDRDPGDQQVQEAVARHHAMLENFYPVTAEIYRGLGQMYVEHREFRAYYDKYRPGLADFLQAAIEVYCQHSLDA